MAKIKSVGWKGILGAISSGIDNMLLQASASLGKQNTQACVTIKINITRQEDGRLEFFPTAETKGKQYSIGGKAKGKSVLADLVDGSLQNIQIGMFDKKHEAFTPEEDTTFEPEDLDKIEKALAETAEE